MFAENNRISHRQLTRQMILSLISPFLLCLTGQSWVRGINGVIGAGIIGAILGFYVIVLVRLGPVYERLDKVLGRGQSIVITLIYVIYALFTGGYLAQFLGNLCGQWLLPGISYKYITLGIIFICALGSHKGMEKRGRMGEVSYILIFGSLVLLFLLAMFQGEKFGWEEVVRENVALPNIGWAVYTIMGAFLPITFLPFLLGRVARPSSTGRAIAGAIGILILFLAATLILLPITLGWNRVLQEPIPILPLLAGTNLPGDVLARFDVIWISLLVYAMLYSLGSLFYYKSHILNQAGISISHWVLAVIVALIALDPLPGYEIQDYYSKMVAYGFLPLLTAVTFYVFLVHKFQAAKGH